MNMETVENMDANGEQTCSQTEEVLRNMEEEIQRHGVLVERLEATLKSVLGPPGEDLRVNIRETDGMVPLASRIQRDANNMAEWNNKMLAIINGTQLDAEMGDGV